MMMERAKTAPTPEEAKKSPPTISTAGTTSSNSVPISSQERMQDLERRLINLDPGLSSSPALEVNWSAMPARPSALAATPTPVAASTSEASESVKDTATNTGKNNPLLARIMAAQERARLAEQKEKEAKAAAALSEAQRQKTEEEAAAKLKELQRQQEQHTQHSKQKNQAAQEKRDEILRELEGLPTELPSAAIPIMKSLDTPPPPPFDAMGIVAPRPQNHRQSEYQVQSTAQVPPPPSFDIVEQMINTPAHSAPIPSAPPESAALDHLEGVLPMPAPVQANNMPPLPSFADFEHQLQQQNKQEQSASPTHNELTADLSFDLDEVDGIPLSPSERQQMIAEQRQLYESIMKEKAANDAAIARLSADAFDSRSAAARAEERNEHMDSTGRDLVTTTATGGPKTEGDEINVQPRFVKIGNNQTVALHGQERTKKAIKDGTAILVQCINCQNWMQVTATATLMFCPVCQVVCPVIPQNEVLTKEEAIQLTMDRKLAEKLQAEAYAIDDAAEKKTSQESGYFGRLFGVAESSAATTTAASPGAAAISTTAPSWWDKISSIISYGVEDEHRERGEIGVTRPPGASSTASSISTYPGQRRDVTLTPATVTGDRSPISHRNEETQGLLHPVVVNGNEANLPAGRVAEQRPLFSCVLDSVSNAASAVFSTGDAPVDEEGNVYGIDSRSLLAVTERGVGDGAEDYSHLRDME